MISRKEAALGKKIKIPRITRNNQVSIREAGSLRPAIDKSSITMPEPPLSRIRTRPKISWWKRAGLALAATGALLGGVDNAGQSSQTSDSGSRPDSSTSLLADGTVSTSATRPISFSLPESPTHIEQAEIGNQGSRTDTVSKVARTRLIEAGVANPTKSDILQVTTAIGSLTPEVNNLDVVQPKQVLNVPDRASIRTLVQASRGQSQDAELNRNAAILQTAINTQGYNNARDEAGLLMAQLARITENSNTGTNIETPPTAEPTPAPATPSPSETPSAVPTNTPETPTITSGNQSESDNGLLTGLLIFGGIVAAGVGGTASRRFVLDELEKKRAARQNAERQSDERRGQRYWALPEEDIPWRRRTEEELQDELRSVRRTLNEAKNGGGPLFYTRAPQEVLTMLTSLGIEPQKAQEMLNAAIGMTPSVESLFDADTVYRIRYTIDQDNANMRNILVEPTLIRLPEVEIPAWGRTDEDLEAEAAYLAMNKGLTHGRHFHTRQHDDLIQVLRHLGHSRKDAERLTNEARDTSMATAPALPGQSLVYRLTRSHDTYIPELIRARVVPDRRAAASA